MRLRRPGPPEDLALEMDFMTTLLEFASACGFAIWAEAGQLGIRTGIQGEPEQLYWGHAGQLVILWRLGRRAGELLENSYPTRKPAASAAVASQKSRRRA